MAEDKIRVKTNDGKILNVDLDIAKQWVPINTMYEVLGADNIDTNEKPIELENVNEETLNKIIEWAVYHRQDGLNTDDNRQKRRAIDISSWDEDFFKVDQAMLFGIIMASNYLGMTTLLDMGCKTVANMIKDKTPAQVRQIFNIPNDLPPFPVPQ